MWQYVAPLRDMRFVIEDVLQAPSQWAQMPAFSECDADLCGQVLEEAAKYATEVLAPTNAPGDLQGCDWTPDGVKTPAGYAEAYRAFCEGGWPALACDPDWGGQGLPQLINAALYEMLIAANQAWAMYPGLLHGAYECIKAHGTEELKAAYLPKIVSGEWLATMCLTESHAGSDLGLIRTKGLPQADGSLRISGQKIFISGGDQDMTENIVHLVIFRLPDAPAGSKGISLALVPKFLPDGSRNTVYCDSIEKKMGIKGSATSVMRFDDAKGWLIGRPNRGLEAMFLMMNSARVHVAIQGLAHLDNAARNAVAYAQERLQMRAVKKPEAALGAQAAADPIAFHPATRRNLLELLAIAQAGRVMAYWGAQCVDAAEYAANPDDRSRAHDFASLLTPVLKSFLTEVGHYGSSRALQTWGGHGYVHDYGIEQAVRDSRIALIYEGTNEIQALDLLGRKIAADGGKKLDLFLDELQASAADAPSDFRETLSEFIAIQRRLTQELLSDAGSDPELIPRVACDYLKGMSYTLLCWAWARIVTALKSADGDDPWVAEQHKLARFGLQWLMDDGRLAWKRVEAFDRPLPWL